MIIKEAGQIKSSIILSLFITIFTSLANVDKEFGRCCQHIWLTLSRKQTFWQVNPFDLLAKKFVFHFYTE